jgi:hypothetical protein
MQRGICHPDHAIHRVSFVNHNVLEGCLFFRDGLNAIKKIMLCFVVKFTSALPDSQAKLRLRLSEVFKEK